MIDWLYGLYADPAVILIILSMTAIAFIVFGFADKKVGLKKDPIDAKADFFHYFINLFVFGPVLERIVVLTLTFFFFDLLNGLPDFSLSSKAYVDQLPVALQVLLAFLIIDFVQYWFTASCIRDGFGGSMQSTTYQHKLTGYQPHAFTR